MVYPCYGDQFGNDVVAGHAKHFGADLVLTLCDVWVLGPAVFASMRTASWFPVDCDPLSSRDREWFHKSQAAPIAMARHGHRMLIEAGFDAAYVPHGVDTIVFAPGDQAAARDALGIPADAFVVGINAANKGTRKAFPQQVAAFAKLRRAHPDAVLLLHTDLVGPADGLDLITLTGSLGLPEGAVRFSDQYLYRAGMFSERYMAAWYNACDLVSNATYGEGFGLATLEAQACGVPVVVTDNSASSELVGSGWKVPGTLAWQNSHHAWWSAPAVDRLARVFEKAYQGQAAKRRGEQAREFALAYDADRVLKEHWVPLLDRFATQQ